MPHLSLHIKWTTSGRRIFLVALAVYFGLHALIVGGILLFQPFVRTLLILYAKSRSLWRLENGTIIMIFVLVKEQYYGHRVTQTPTGLLILNCFVLSGLAVADCQTQQHKTVLLAP